MDSVPDEAPTTDPSGLAVAVPGTDRRRILLIDSLIALAVAALNLPLFLLAWQSWETDPSGTDAGVTIVLDLRPGTILFYGTLLAAPLAFRRLWPRSTHLVICSLYLLPVLSPTLSYGDSTPLFVSLFSVAVAVRRWRTVAALGAFTLCVMLLSNLFVFGGLGTYRPLSDLAFSLPYAALPVALALILARSLRGERDRVERLQKETIRLALASEIRAEEAAGAERRRLAAELHDIVAHHVNLMVVQAETGPYLPNDTAAQTTFTSIATTGRTALGELDRLLGVLRKQGDGVPGSAPMAPLPTLHEVPDLVNAAVQAGIPVRLEPFEVPADLDPALSATGHRIVQECVTNLIKHGDHDRPAVVSIRHDAAALRIDVDNQISGARSDRSGYGLLSMRSRLEAFDGTLDVTDSDGWFRVRAVIPLGDRVGPMPVPMPTAGAGATA